MVIKIGRTSSKTNSIHDGHKAFEQRASDWSAMRKVVLLWRNNIRLHTPVWQIRQITRTHTQAVSAYASHVVKNTEALHCCEFSSPTAMIKPSYVYWNWLYGFVNAISRPYRRKDIGINPQKQFFIFILKNFLLSLEHISRKVWIVKITLWSKKMHHFILGITLSNLIQI